MSEYCRDDFGLVEQADDDFKMWQGLVGPHYTPSVSEDGTLSWTNDGQLPNPEDVSIKGPPGAPGSPGGPGPGVPAGGTTGQILAKASDEDYDGEWIDQPEMDAGQVSYDSTEAYDDGTVGKELTTINSALSSLSSVTEIIDTASGAIASFPDGAGLPMRSLLAQINPQQDLHGYDAPWAGGSGKNLINQDGTDTSNGYVHKAYINTSGTVSQAEGNWDVMEYASVEPNTTYTISGSTGGTANGFVEYNSSKTMVAHGTASTIPFTFTTGANTYYVRFNRKYDTDTQVQLEKGSSATTYSPYSNVCPITGWDGLSGWVEEEYDPTEQPTFSVTWQTEAGTVYGGTVDVVTGVLTADMGIKTELWKNFTNEVAMDTNLIRRQTNISSAKGDTANAQKTISNIAPFVRTIADISVHVSMASSGNYLYAILPPTTDPDLEITFCYPLATTQTYQLTPQQISTLLGNNTVFVDTGDVSVTYQASIKGYIDKVLGS